MRFLPYPFVDQHGFAVQKTVTVAAANIPSQASLNKMNRAHLAMTQQIEQTHSTHT
jgi:hypothetical protein